MFSREQALRRCDGDDEKDVAAILIMTWLR